METLLVLTDFSYTAYNATRYAIELANQLKAARVIIYHSLRPLDTPPPYASEVDDRWSKALERLKDLKELLEMFANISVQIEVRTNYNKLEVEIEEIDQRNNVSLLILGSNGNACSPCLGEHASTLIESCPLPVLVIPPDTVFQTIEKAVFACNLKNTSHLSIQRIKNFKQLLQAKLANLYFNGDAADEKKAGRALFALTDFIKADSSCIQGEKVIDNVLQFSAEHNADLLLVIHQTPPFLQNIMLQYNHTKGNATIGFPLLILKPLIYRNGLPSSGIIALKPEIYSQAQ